MRERMADYITGLQETIVTKLETYGPGQKFRRESWARDEGGGGLSCTFPPLDTNDSEPCVPSFLAELTEWHPVR